MKVGRRSVSKSFRYQIKINDKAFIRNGVLFIFCSSISNMIFCVCNIILMVFGTYTAIVKFNLIYDLINQCSIIIM